MRYNWVAFLLAEMNTFGGAGSFGSKNRFGRHAGLEWGVEYCMVGCYHKLVTKVPLSFLVELLQTAVCRRCTILLKKESGTFVTSLS
jgi:hypothetical protein